MTRLVLLSMMILALGCSEKQSAPPPESDTAGPASTAPQEAHELFRSLCSTCHGTSGKGDGVAAASLNPKPRNYTDKAWQASVTDDHIKQVILGGGASVGKSPLMPASPQLKDKPEVVTELVKIVRGFGS